MGSTSCETSDDEPGEQTRNNTTHQTLCNTRITRPGGRFNTALLAALTVFFFLTFAAMAAAEKQVWSGTLTVKELPGGIQGCSNDVEAGERCSESAVLTDDDFTEGDATYAVHAVFVRSNGRLEFSVRPILPANLRSLTLYVGEKTYDFDSADIANHGSGTSRWAWDGSALSWTVDETVSLRLTDLASMSNDATLNTLGISTGSLSETFESTTMSYTATVESGVTRITVTPATTDSSATISWLDSNGSPLADADGSTEGFQADLSTGENVVKIKVTAEDTTTTQTYTLTIVRQSEQGTTPTVSIEAVHAKAAPRIAHPEFRVTRSASSASPLTVNLSITQAVMYLSDTSPSVTIPANETSATVKLRSTYSGSTSGDITASVAAGTGYEPAAAPDDSATVAMVAADPLLIVRWAQNDYKVREGGNLDVAFKVTTGANVPQPRESVDYSVKTVGDTAKSPSDYSVTAVILHVEPGDYSAEGAAFSATKTVRLQTVADTEDEEDERFFALLEHAAGNPIDPTCPTTHSDSSNGCYAFVTITEDALSDATLSALEISPGSINETFASETTSYTASVESGVARITVTPTTTDSIASLAYQAADESTLADADGSTEGFQVDLSTGENVVKIKVTAEDTTTTQTYTLTIVRQSEQGTTPTVSIEAVHAKAAPIIAHPEFRVTRSASSASPLTVNLSITQAVMYLSDTSPSVTIPANETSATVKLRSTYSGSTSGNITASVAAGTGYEPAAAPNDSATVAMVAADPLLIVSWAQNDYIVREGGNLDVAIKAKTGANVPQPRETLIYSVSARADTAGSPDDYAAISEILRVEPGDYTADGNTFSATKTVTVQTVADAEDEGDERFGVVLELLPGSLISPTCPCRASVIITEEDISDATLSALEISPGSINEAFAPETTSYTASVESGVARITVTPTTSDPDASVAFFASDNTALTDADTSSPNTFEVDLAMGENVVKVKVTAEDTTTTQTYTLRVTHIDGGMLRLVGGNTPHEGRLEIFYGGRWGTVCDDYWTDEEADVACRALGFPEGSVGNGGRFLRAHFGEGAGPIHLDDLLCVGNETSLIDCPRANNNAVGVHNCDHSEDVGVRCAVGGPEISEAQGIPAVSVADAEVHEEPKATLDFVVTIRPAPERSEAVYYRTVDGTARAGSDYVAETGLLVFPRGVTTRTVSIPVLDDSLDEGSETMRLELSLAPSGKEGIRFRIADGTAIGTITNTDPMPKAWLARFGREAAEHVTDAIAERLRGARTGVVLGGQSLALGRDPLLPADPNARLALGDYGIGRDGAGNAFGSPGGVSGEDAEATRREIEMSEFMLASSFHMASAEKMESGPRWSVWGRGARSNFSGKEDTLSLEGDVTTGTLGVDYERERWLFGVALARSAGEGSFRMSGACEAGCAGEVESTLMGVYPYARYRVSERLSLWGALGQGQGDLTLSPEGARHIETDIEMRMAAAGVRGVLLPATGTGGYELALRADLLVTRTTSEAAAGLAAAEAETSRIRVLLEGSREFKLEGGVLTPSLEVGLRYDGSDAETGSGLEVGGSLRYSSGSLTMEVSARGLLAHADSDYEEWGVSGSVLYAPGDDGRGLSVRVGSGWGADSGSAEQLWSQRFGGIQAGAFDPETRLDAEVGYGFDARRGLLTPYAGVAMSDSGEIWRAGARWRIDPAFDVSLEASLKESEYDEKPESGVLLRCSRRW